MKKILFVTRVLAAGGAEQVMAEVVKQSVSQGCQCKVIAIQPAERESVFPPEVPFAVLPAPAGGLRGKWETYSQVRRLAKEFKPDLVMSMPEDIGIYVVLGLLGTGIPVVVSERNNPWVMPDKKISRIARRIAYPFAKGLIFQTKQAASFFPKSQQKKGVVLPNPLDLSRIPPVYTGPREKKVLGAGRLDDQKNFPLLLEAFRRFHSTHPEYTLEIYGEGAKRAELEALAAQLLPLDVWKFPGRVNDLPQRVARAGMFVLSSDYEGVPNVLIEAMAMGTPCVSTDCAPGGAASLIDNGKNGILVPVGDAQALSDGLCFMADHPEEAAAMGKESIRVRQTLDARIVSAKWLDYLEECAQK